MAQVYYHIGLHKTATTFLQNQYFTQLPLTYIKGSYSYTNALRSLGMGDIVLFSDENMSGQLFCGDKFSDFQRVVCSIKEIHPDAGIIVGFRKHEDFILSSYKQYLHEGGALHQRDFFQAEGKGVLNLEDVRFSEYILFLKERFSKVMIYTIDDVKNIEEFNVRFCNFLGIEKIEVKLGKSSENRGVRTNFQVFTLYVLNLINLWIKNRVGINLFYNKLFKAFRVTPRHVCQGYLPDFGRHYVLDDTVQRLIIDELSNDWNFVIDSKMSGK